MSDYFYTHTVQYYETDAMRIVHHSNYIRWMEEARLAYLGEMGLAYDQLEARGIIAPVLSAACEYRQSTRYGDTVKIYAKIDKFDGVRFFLSYRITSPDDKILHATGSTSHCFLSREMKLINIKRVAPDIYDFFKGCAD